MLNIFIYLFIFSPVTS